MGLTEKSDCNKEVEVNCVKPVTLYPSGSQRLTPVIFDCVLILPTIRIGFTCSYKNEWAEGLSSLPSSSLSHNSYLVDG